MRPSFDQLLGDLANPQVALPVDQLDLLSDLDQAQMDRLIQVWPGLPEARRLLLVTHLGQLADTHFELSFERINRFALNDPAPDVRRVAIANLWECDDPTLAEPLRLTLVSDAEEAVRSAAADALGHFVYLGELDRLPGASQQQLEDALLAAVRADPGSPVSLRCLESLGYSSRREVPDLVEAAYRSDVEERRRSALCAMGRSASTRWADSVVDALNSPSPALRAEAARAAGELELRRATATLIELLEDVKEEVRQASIWSLGQIGGQEAAEALESLLERSPDPQEAALIDDALENLAFLEAAPDLAMLDFDQPEDDED